MNKCLIITCCLLLVILSGCAHQIAPPFAHSIPQSKAGVVKRFAPANMKNWNIQGAISIQNQNKIQMGSFSWEQVGPRYAINFYGPLNIGAIGIAGQPGKVTLNTPTKSVSARTGEYLMRQELGWYLPVSNLYYWVQGLPAPGLAKTQKQDEDHHLIYLQQQGWTIRYANYQSLTDHSLPHKIWMENSLLRIKLVINHWNSN